ncbi:MAG: succinate dehydrogenase, partial [Planctomycetota bacterium]
GLPNTNNYPYAANYRYTLQRATGIIAFIFIVLHVFHMHGWFHAEAWLDMVGRFGGAAFSPYNATSTAGEALQGVVITIVYAIGVLACVYHLANGIWTMGITWGVWTSAKGQARASALCSLFGVGLAIVGLTALFGIRSAVQGDGAVEQIRADENQMYDYKVDAKEIEPNEHKRWKAENHSDDVAEAK